MKTKDVEIGATYLVKVGQNLAPVVIVSENEHGGWNGESAKTGKAIRIKSAQRLRKRMPAEPDRMKPEEAKAIAAADQENARLAEERASNPDGQTASERAMAESQRVLVYRDGQGKAWRWALVGSEPSPKRYMAKDQALRGAKRAHPDAEITVGDPSEPAADTATKRGQATTGTSSAKRRDTGEHGAKQGPREGKRSALDAAAQVLADAAEPMNCKDLITAMAERGLWSSPNGKTPANTLYAAISREIKVKGAGSRFAKGERGMFTATGKGA